MPGRCGIIVSLITQSQVAKNAAIYQEIISLYLSVVDLCRVLSCNVIPRPVLNVRESLVM